MSDAPVQVAVQAQRAVADTNSQTSEKPHSPRGSLEVRRWQELRRVVTTREFPLCGNSRVKTQPAY